MRRGGNLAEPYVYRNRKPERAQNVLSFALRKFGLDKDIARYQFVLHWKDIVGEAIASRTRPECLRNSCLVVRVIDSTWAQELSFQKNLILRRLRKYVDKDVVINDVTFYIGDLTA